VLWGDGVLWGDSINVGGAPIMSGRGSTVGILGKTQSPRSSGMADPNSMINSDTDPMLVLAVLPYALKINPVSDVIDTYYLPAVEYC
jgi:hypothetical protein